MDAGALRALHRAGKAVPDDVAVIGFDGLYAVDDLTDPPLTSVTQDLDAALAEMARRLFSMIDRTKYIEPATVVLPVHLTRRSSA